jgi:hypothetical protein
LEYALDLAGENRTELEKVLQRYRNDKQKLQATHFLIENMIGHAGYDATYLSDLKDLYAKHEAISVKYNWDDKNKDWRKEIDSLWKVDKRNPQYSNRHQRKDIELVKAKWLINEIDRSFIAWQENAFTKNLPFDDFCRYILPYRVKNETCMNSGREDFYNRYQHHFKDTSIPIITLVDTLLYKYAALKHNGYYAANFPIYENRGFEQVKFGLCSARVWFNYALLSAVGMPAAVDFVPAWGNRNSSHEWSSILIDGETYPFEPFWDHDRWKYKKIYGNTVTDSVYGKFRLPKVFRHTYKYQMDNPFLGKEDVLALFKYPFIEDVSADYFETTDVTCFIQKKKSEEAEHAYLCIYNWNKWIPAQCAEIKNENAIFKRMGRDLLYLPILHQLGQIKPIGDPFILTIEGQKIELIKNNEVQDIVIRAMMLSPNMYNRAVIKGAQFSVSDSGKETNKRVFHTITDMPDWWERNKIKLADTINGRYIHMTFPTDTVALNDLIVYAKDEKGRKQLQNIKVLNNSLKAISSHNKASYLADGICSTGFQGTVALDNKEIIFDLGKAYELESIEYLLYTKTTLKEDKNYVLEYWDENRWNKVESKQKGKDDFLVFKQVPKGTMYRLITDNDRNNRVFTYDNGIIRWY